MSRLTRDDWFVYSILRELQGKAYAEKYRHKRNAHNAKFGINPDRNGDGWQLVKDYGIDGVLVKRFVPGHPDPVDLEAQYYIEPVRSAFDCTGCQFTSWLECFTVPGGVWVYHRICVDC